MSAGLVLGAPVTWAQGSGTRADSTALATRDSALVHTVPLNRPISTAIGIPQRSLERGSSVSVIVVDSLAVPPLADFSDLLVAGAPGMRVQRSSGTTGAGASIHLRGLTSLLARGDPLLIVDGVRVDNATAASLVDLGPQQPSRFDDLDPEEIERVEVLPGPAAGALFGGGAADGVILVTTKRGRPGRPRWHLHSEYGAISDVTTYPANFNRPLAAWPYGCSLDRQTLTGCTPGELQSWNPLENASPFRTGSHERNGLSVSGGSNAVRYHVAGDYDEERGVFSNNGRRRVNVRTNIGAHIGRFMNVRLTGGYVDGTLRLPLGSGGTALIGEGLFGAAEDDSVLRGYQNTPVAYQLQLGPHARSSRLVAGLTATVRPLRWLTSTTTIGMDSVVVSSAEITPHRDSLGIVLPDSRHTITGSRVATYTANTDLSAAYDLSPSVHATSSIGVQYLRQRGQDSILTYSGSVDPITAGPLDALSLTRRARHRSTLGVLLRQQLAWRDRVFVTAAVRRDRGNGTGPGEDEPVPIVSPSVNASWLISDEPFFPRAG